MSTEAHDDLIRAVQEYCKWQERFEYEGSDAAGMKARFWLSEARRFASIRRVEIQAKRKDRNKTRIKKVGRPKKITS